MFAQLIVQAMMKCGCGFFVRGNMCPGERIGDGEALNHLNLFLKLLEVMLDGTGFHKH